MTASGRNKTPDFFEDHTLDPVNVAAGTPTKEVVRKKKAGFYVSEDVLERFNRRFHQMKLDGFPIENKSALLEWAVSFALDDLEKGEKSRLMAMMGP